MYITFISKDFHYAFDRLITFYGVCCVLFNFNHVITIKLCKRARIQLFVNEREKKVSAV